MFTIEWDKYNKDKILGNWRRKELNVSWQVKDGFAAEETDRLCLNDYTCAFCMEKANNKDVELEIADIHWIIEKARDFQKNKQTNKQTTPASLTTLKPLTMLEHNKLWKILKVMGIPDHLICLLRNFYVKSRTNRTMDWFKIGRVVLQGRRQWQPTPGLLPGNPMDGGAW